MAPEKTTTRTHKMIPVEDGLFTLPVPPENDFHLIAGKCRRCGTVVFPKQRFCIKCFRDDMTEIALSHRGKITTWTIIRLKPPGYQGEVPYVLGEVALPEGVTVRTHLLGVDPGNPAVRIGQEAEAVLEKIYEDDAGNDIVCYKFSVIPCSGD